MIYVLIQDFQYTTSSGEILTLKKGTGIDRKEGDDCIISLARKEYRIKSIIVENNPQFFEKIDLKSKLVSLFKANTKRTAPKMAEIVEEFIKKEILEDKELVDHDILKSSLEACRQMYISTENDKWLLIIKNAGWSIDGKGVFKNV